MVNIVLIIVAIFITSGIGLFYYVQINNREIRTKQDVSKSTSQEIIAKDSAKKQAESEDISPEKEQKVILDGGDDELLSSKKHAICANNCGSDLIVGAEGLTYGVVLGPDCRCWLDRNLGATRVAISATDESAYGYYYQWGRLTDGHQDENSTTTSVVSVGDIPGHGNFITPYLPPDVYARTPYDWRVPQNDNLWQGANSINNPCPTGWRVPTRPEWDAIANYFAPQNSEGAFNSILKLTLAGLRDRIDGTFTNQGISGWYWSSSSSGGGAIGFVFSNSDGFLEIANSRAEGLTVRCVKD